MNSYRIDSNYAKALYMLASDPETRHDGEQPLADRVADDMKLVGSVMAENRELKTVFANPTMPRERKMALVREIFGGRVSEATEAFLLFVVRKNRSVNMRGISEAYLRLWREESGIVLSDLSTRQPIDDEARALVTRMVAETTGKQVELQNHIDEQMLGGFMLEFDGKMYDARLRTKIRKLKMEFAKNDYESKL